MTTQADVLAPTRRISVNLPQEEVDALQKISQARHITLTDALRRAIAMERFIEETLERGAKLLIEEPDKTVRELLIR
jgi:hypothetical protein